MRRRGFTKTEKRAYRRSNAQTSLGLAPSTAMIECVREIRTGLDTGDRIHAEASGQVLLDFLCDAIRMPAATLKLCEKAPAKFRKGQSGRRKAVWKLYGTCDNKGNIEMAFRTAVRKQVFAFKTFLQTLIHEFGHHYDFQKLRLAASFHTRGFYARVDSLYRPMLEML